MIDRLRSALRLISFCALGALAACAVHVIEPANLQTGVAVPVSVVVSLPLGFDGRFAARLDDRDITSAFQFDASRRLTTASLPLARGLYRLDASACWSFNAFIPLGACSASSARFETGEDDSRPYLTVEDSGTGSEAFVVDRRIDCPSSRQITVTETATGATVFSDYFSAPIMRIRELALNTGYSFVAVGCSKTDVATATLRIVPPPDFGSVEKLRFVLPTTYTLNYPDFIDRIQGALDRVNIIYRQSGIHKRFTVGDIRTYDDQSPNCSKRTVNDPCDTYSDPDNYAADMSTVFCTYTLPNGYGVGAAPWLRSIYFVIAPANPYKDFFIRETTGPLSPLKFASVLSHELAHLYYAGAPEYYSHSVNDKTTVEPLFVATEGAGLYEWGAVPARYYEDPMFGLASLAPPATIDVVRFGPLTQRLVNDNTGFAAGGKDFYHYYRRFHPASISLTVLDAAAKPLTGVHVGYYCLTGWTPGDIAETTARADFMTDGNGKGTLATPVPWEATECVVMGLKLSKPGYVPTLRTVTSIELEEAAFVYGHASVYGIAVTMPRDVENADVDCADSDRRVAVTAKTQTSIAVHWCAVDGADQYEVLMRREGTSAFATGNNYSSTATTEATVTGLLEGSRYHLYIAPRVKDCSVCTPVGRVVEAVVATSSPQ